MLLPGNPSIRRIGGLYRSAANLRRGSPRHHLARPIDAIATVVRACQAASLLDRPDIRTLAQRRRREPKSRHSAQIRAFPLRTARLAYSAAGLSPHQLNHLLIKHRY
jgi:hypothetical protein